MVFDNHAWAWAAWAWVVVFTAFHVYWFLGGRFGLAGPLPTLSFSLISVLFRVAVAAMFATGLVVPIAAVRPWGRRVPRWMLAAALWAGCLLLLLRGTAGVVDDLLRMTGLSAHGLTGLTQAQVFGTARPSATMMWSSRATDWYFTLGGLLFGAAAAGYRRAR